MSSGVFPARAGGLRGVGGSDRLRDGLDINNVFYRACRFTLEFDAMNWIGRSDKPLIAGLTVAVLLVFSKQVRALLDFARDVEQTSGVALLLPLIILTVVFLFQQASKRQEAKARAALAEAESREAQERAAELEQLVVFGQALGRSLDLGAIRDVALQHLGTLTGTTEAQVVIRRDGHWQMFVDLAQQ